MSGDFAAPRPYIRLNGLLRNTTKNEGDKVRLRCDVIGSPLPIRFEWFKNNAPLERKKNRNWKVTNRDMYSRLRFNKLRVLDSGFYRCVASNSAGSVNTTAIIKVQPGNLRKDSDFHSSPSGGAVRGGTLTNEGDGMRHLPGDIDGSRPGSSTWDGNTESAYDGPLGNELSLGSCNDYVGRACEDYLSGQRVLVTTTVQEELLDVERNIRAAMMFISNSSDISSTCKDFSHQVACFHSYQVCDPDPLLTLVGDITDEPPTLQICAPDCYHLQGDVCPKEYDAATKHDLIGRGKLLPDCKELETTQSSTRCIPVEGLNTDEEAVNPTHWCYVGSGKSYRGRVSRTVTGRECLKWSEARGEYSTGSGYKGLRGAENYCRNPRGQRSKPWCYSTNGGQEEYCKVEECPRGMFPRLRKLEAPDSHTLPYPNNGRIGGSPNGRNLQTVTPNGQGTEGWNFVSEWNSLAPHWQYTAMGGAAMGVVLLLTLLVCWCCRCRRKKSRRRTGEKSSANGSLLTNGYNIRKPNGTPSSHHMMMGVGGGGMELTSLLSPPPPPNRTPPPPFSELPIHEFPPDQLRFGEYLGEGQFGKVWKGHLLGYNAVDDDPMQVAIKSLKEDALPRQQQDFQMEAEMMGKLRHPNIVEMLGVAVSGNQRCMVFEYMIHGDLHEFLLLRSPYQDQQSSVDPDRIRLDQTDFLHISTQIAAGMDYLSTCHYVHRDLATRNCLVTDRLTIKIADFGLMRDTYAADYYRAQTKNLLPIRWMPPEAICFGKFSEDSDVWSYGVTLWEIYSYGTQPYYGYANTEVIELIRTRCLLECPENCPSRMYSLMVECWHEAPNRRPKFQEIQGRLQTWSVMSSPAQSSAMSAHHNPHHILHNRSGSTHSGASAGRASRQSGSTHHSNPHHHHQGPLQTMVTMNGVIPFPGTASFQTAQMKNSPNLSGSRGGNSGVNSNLLSNGRNGGPQYFHSNSFDLDSSVTS